MDATHTETTAPRGGLVAAYALILLLSANIINYADRALLGIVVEPIRKELLLSDTEISIVSGFAFSLFFLIAAIGIARWVDRGNRRLILALGVALWSGATAATAFAQGFVSLSLCRMLVGVGSDGVPGRAVAAGRPLSGSEADALGVNLSGEFGDRHHDRLGPGRHPRCHARLADDVRGVRRSRAGAGRADRLHHAAHAAHRRPRLATAAGSRTGHRDPRDLAIPGLAWLAFGYGASNMALACLPVWSPAFLLRSHDVQLAEVGALVGPPAVIGGITGGILSGILATRLIQRSGSRGAGLIVPIIALPLAVPAYAIFLFAPSLTVVVVAIAAMNFLLSSGLGPCVALAVSLVAPTQRGVTSTVMLIVQNLLAFALGPLLIGIVSDSLAPDLWRRLATLRAGDHARRAARRVVSAVGRATPDRCGLDAPTMRLDRLDLNLLIALDALLQERGVSLAADRLNLSQSAASGALARLREYFKDDLLVLQGRSMALTPRAEKLVDPVRSVLEQIRTTIMVAEPFDPATSDRMLSVMATDYVFEILLTPAIVACATEAPGIRFELVPIVEHPVDALQRGHADVLIGIDNVVSTDHPSALLYLEDFVVAGWRDNPVLNKPMTLACYEQLGHVAVRFGRQTTSYEGTAARLRSIARRVEVVAPSFTSVGSLLVGTNRIATIHRLLAVRMAETLPLKLMELPFEMPPVREIAQWSSRSANDPAIAWLVERLKQIAEQLRVSSGAPTVRSLRETAS